MSCDIRLSASFGVQECAKRETGSGPEVSGGTSADALIGMPEWNACSPFYRHWTRRLRKAWNNGIHHPLFRLHKNPIPHPHCSQKSCLPRPTSPRLCIAFQLSPSSISFLTFTCSLAISARSFLPGSPNVSRSTSRSSLANASFVPTTLTPRAVVRPMLCPVRLCTSSYAQPR